MEGIGELGQRGEPSEEKPFRNRECVSSDFTVLDSLRPRRKTYQGLLAGSCLHDTVLQVQRSVLGVPANNIPGDLRVDFRWTRGWTMGARAVWSRAQHEAPSI
jgi:hypothetical protein